MYLELFLLSLCSFVVCWISCLLWHLLWRSVSAVEEIPGGAHKNSRHNLLSLGSTFSVSTKDYTAAAASQKCLFQRKEKVTNEKCICWSENVNITKEKPLIQLSFANDLHINYCVTSLDESPYLRVQISVIQLWYLRTEDSERFHM